MRVYKLSIPEVGGNRWMAFSESGLDGLNEELKTAEIGEVLNIEVVDMPDAEFKNLPEFEGW